MTVNIAEFRRRLSEYLQRVRAGEEVVIAERDRPIGRVVPYTLPKATETLVLREPERGYGRLSELKFESIECSADPLADLLKDRQR